VDDRVGLREQAAEVGAELGRQELEAGDEPLGGIQRSRGALGEQERALLVDLVAVDEQGALMLVDGDEVGEGAADVDSDAEASAQ